MTQLTPLQQSIAGAIRDVPGYPHEGVLFKDITPLLADPERFGEAVSALAGLSAGPGASADRGASAGPGAGRYGQVDVVAGIEARGFILAAPIALALGAGFVPIRKKGKLPWTTAGASYELEYATADIEIHTDAVSPGQRVLLVDDVLATGGTAAAAHGLLSDLGAEVVAVSVLIELGFLSGRDRLPGITIDTVLHY